MSKAKTLRGFVDGIEGASARVLLGEDESLSVVLPLAWLPRGVREGDVLGWTVEILSEGAERSETETLMEGLGDRP